MALAPFSFFLSEYGDVLDCECGIEATVGLLAGSFGCDEVLGGARLRNLGSLVEVKDDRAPENVFWRAEII